MELLKKLTEANSAPGFEFEVRDIMKQEIQSYGGSLRFDHTGSVIGEKKGTSDKPKILVAGHMDEVAFMVKEITKEGFLRFTPLGGWWEQVLLAQRVVVMAQKKNYTGVIGSKAPHVLLPEERKKVYPMREMYIDVGAKNRDQVKSWGIKVGDPIVPICPFELLPDNETILAKALDNRVGCYLSIQVLKELRNTEHPNTIYAGATVQEEVGLRGAATAPYVVDPDVAIALDVGIAQDGPGEKGEPTLGAGPLITFMDASMVPNVRFRDFIIDIAEKNNIPYQTDIMMGGGTDAGKFHLFKQGVPTIAMGVAARYIHSHVSMISKQDLDNTVKLLVAILQKLDEKEYANFIQY